MAFKNNYKDDILDLSANEKRKYEMTTNADGTVSFEDRSVYEQIGDTFGAKELNEISEKLNISGERIRYNTSNNMVEIMDESGNWNPWSSGISEEFIIKENSILPGTEYKNITINLQGEFVRFISQDSGKIMFYCDLTAYNGKYLKITLKADYEVKVCKCYGISSSYEIIKSIQPNSEFNNYYIPIDGNFDTNYKYLMLIFETYGFYDFKYISITASDGTGTGGGSNVEWNQIQSSGTKIAEVTIDGATTEVYAPSESGGGGGSSAMKTVSGTFTSPATSQGTIHVDLGFKADIISVILPLNNKNTCSYFNKFIRTDGAYWDLKPAEGNVYFNSFDSPTGETGICAIDETGFTFRTNNTNAGNAECTYIAYKF